VRITRIDRLRDEYAHLYLSPHFDDLVLSCGGRIVHQRLRGERVLVVDVFAGKPAPGAAMSRFAVDHHQRWGGKRDPIADRRREERQVLDALGVDFVWLDHLDAIYRGDQYRSDAELFGEVQPGDDPTLATVTAQLEAIWRRTVGAVVYSPLGVGNHVDHQICRRAALALRPLGANVILYEDFPYASREGQVASAVATMPERLEPEVFQIGAAVDEKIRLIHVYRSQIPTLFGDALAMERAVMDYCRSISDRPGGCAERYWRITPHRAPSETIAGAPTRV
jgi:LmbE family N-acetylglucosaminyl deacetylase